MRHLHRQPTRRSTLTITDRPGDSLAVHGLRVAGRVLRNPTTSQLYTAALDRGEGVLAEDGPLVVDTGRFTGRSPKDKFIVREPGSEDRIWWSDTNGAISEEHFDGLRAKVVAHLEKRDVYVIDAFCGADPKHRLCGARPHDAPVPRALREDDVHRARRGRARRLRAGRARPPRARGRGRPEAGRHAHRGLHLPPPDARRDPDRRHVLRRRDQEVRLHADERPAAARGRHADALLGERLARTARTSRSSSGSPAPARRRSRPSRRAC